MTLAPGTVLGHYEVLGRLGAGGMGEVYRARDTKLGREVALKLLRGDCAGDPDWLARFRREARSLAALNHGNIATLHGLEEAGGAHYLVMELVPGQTLAQRLARGPLPPEEALGVCRQLAEAVEAAHECGIIHRDLKPANVMITPEGKVKVLDFGLAKSAAPAAGQAGQTAPYEPPSAEGAIVGTPAYMAPEQARGRPVDRRADVWAFACVLYESITGRRPFAGRTYADTLAAVLGRDPDWGALPAGVPPCVARLLRRCLQKDPRRRLRDVGDARLEVEEALDELAHGTPALPTAAPRPAWRWALLATAAALAAFGLGVWTQGLRDGDGHRGPAPAADGHRGPVPAARGWSGQLLLGGTTRAFGPRVSPNGQWLAFNVLHEGQSQVGVMNLDSGEWWVLTRDRTRGPALSVCWSDDSTRLFFDRFFGAPAGVFSVSPFDITPQGATERRVCDGAACPQTAADGSLVVCTVDDQGNYRLNRHWPDGGRPDEAVGPPVEFDPGWPSPVRALRTKNQVVFCGKVLGGEESPPRRRFYLLDLDTKGCRPLPGDDVALDFVPLAVSPDDRFLYTALPAGDLFRVVRTPIEGPEPSQPLLTLTTRPFGLDVGGDGRLYVDQFQRPLEVLRFAAAGGPAERVTAPSRRPETGTVGQPVELPDGRVLLPSKAAGRDRLLAAFAGRDPVPLLEGMKGETAPPAVLVDRRRLAFVSGSGRERRLKIAELAGDQVRVSRTLKDVPGEGLMRLAASPDGGTLYYVHSNRVWEVPTDGSRPPRPLGPGNGVAVHPVTGDLLVQRYGRTGVRLYRVPPRGGAEREVEVHEGPLRLAPYAIGGRAIDRDGRALLPVTSRDSWFWGLALLGPKGGKLQRVPVDFLGEVYLANWGRDGKVLGMGYTLKSELWRLTP
jgi:eukaryotic-like serine/threonine-protein kinase